MTLDLARMRYGIRKAVGLDPTDTDLQDTDIDEYLNRAYWEIQDKFPFREKEQTLTFYTIPGERTYEVPEPFDALKSLSAMQPSSHQFHKLERMTPDEYENRYNELAEERAFPTHYYRENCIFRLWPTPDIAYLMSLKKLATLQNLSNSNASVAIPEVWWEIIMFGGLWRAFIDFGDFDRANQIKGHQVSLINSISPTEAKEERDSRESGLEVFRPAYRV